MEEHAAGFFLRDAFVLLGFALAFVLLFRRFRPGPARTGDRTVYGGVR